MGQETGAEGVWDAYGGGDRLWDHDGHRFQWTQHRDHGPGLELIPAGTGRSVLDLGCGKAANLALVAATGARAVGVDISAVQLDAARARHGDAVELHHATAGHFLAGCDERFDAVVSVFGALWFSDPAVLVPLAVARLKPGGVLALSHRPPEEGEHGEVPHGENHPVTRWSYPRAWWERSLRDAGLADVHGWTVQPPPGKAGSAGKDGLKAAEIVTGRTRLVPDGR
jgi:SAM-dependent methyltransferase